MSLDEIKVSEAIDYFLSLLLFTSSRFRAVPDMLIMYINKQ
jgi:hypothetical protein